VTLAWPPGYLPVLLFKAVSVDDQNVDRAEFAFTWAKTAATWSRSVTSILITIERRPMAQISALVRSA
jgi:hypothetical protein